MITINQTSPKKLGGKGVLSCINYFHDIACQILLPFCDHGRYDLVIENPRAVFSRIQCKYTTALTRRNRKKQYYTVPLKYSAHRRGRDGLYLVDDFDFLWVDSPPAKYLIPSEILFEGKQKRLIALFPKWDKYKV